MVLLHKVLQRAKQFIIAESVARRLNATHEPLASGSVNHRRNLALDYVRLGNDLADQHRDVEADEAFQTGIDRLEKLRRDHPTNFDVRKAELKAYYIAADCSQRDDRIESLSRELVDHAEAALVVFPENPEILHYRILSL